MHRVGKKDPKFLNEKTNACRSTNHTTIISGDIVYLAIISYSKNKTFVFVSHTFKIISHLFGCALNR